MNTNWHKTVYKKPPRVSREEKENWDKTRRFVLYRDRQTCQRCDKYFRAQRDLSVHHIIPRANDGSNEPENLVTLCHLCHDFVECHDLRTLAEIIGSFDDGIIKILESKDNGKTDIFERPEWHKYVYGGVRHGSRQGL